MDKQQEGEAVNHHRLDMVLGGNFNIVSKSAENPQEILDTLAEFQ